MNIKPVRNDRLSDKVVHAIVSMIQNGELKPGDKLPTETVFAEQFGVSRGILREALTLLQSQGYIRRKPKDGTYIQENVESELMSKSVNEVLRQAAYRDLLEFREALELKVVERAIDRASQEDIDEIFEILAANDRQEFPTDMDYYFHYKLAQVSGNTFFMNFIDTYYDLISEMAANSRKDPIRQQEILHEHRTIAQAIQNRDLAAAREAVTHHMSMVDKKAIQ